MRTISTPTRFFLFLLNAPHLELARSRAAGLRPSWHVGLREGRHRAAPEERKGPPQECRNPLGLLGIESGVSARFAMRQTRANARTSASYKDRRRECTTKGLEIRELPLRLAGRPIAGSRLQKNSPTASSCCKSRLNDYPSGATRNARSYAEALERGRAP